MKNHFFRCHYFLHLALSVGLVVLLQSFSPAAWGGYNKWTATTAPSLILTLVIDPSNPSTLYVGSDGYGVYKSSDGGASWINAGTHPPASYIHAVVIDPSNTNTLYIGGSRGPGFGVFKSTDGGGSWTALHGLSDMPVSMAIDPSNTATLYAGTSTGIFKSSDGGNNWTSASKGLTTRDDNSILSLAIDPSHTATIYAGTQGGVFKSIDGGGSWVPARTGLPRRTEYSEYVSYVTQILIDPSVPTTLYAVDEYLVVKSIDGGGTWNPTNQLFIFKSGVGGVPGELALDHSHPGTLYAVLGDKIYSTTNGGDSWTSTYAPVGVHDPFGIVKLVIDSSHTNTTLYGVCTRWCYDSVRSSGVMSYTFSIVPVAITGGTTAITQTSATLNGTVNPNNWPITAQFEYGQTTGYGYTANVTLSPNNGSVEQNVSAPISGLQPGKSYHYRLNVTNSQTGTISGSDATFQTSTLSSYPLTITIAGNGSVTSSPQGINCGSDCSSSYPSGTVVTLTATPVSGSAFTGWGGACSGTGACQVTMSAGTKVTANFAFNPNAECLFNWAQQNYPSLFSPASAVTAVWDIYTYRYYSATNTYLGVSSANNDVYYLGPDGVLRDEGPTSYWMLLANCK